MFKIYALTLDINSKNFKKIISKEVFILNSGCNLNPQTLKKNVSFKHVNVKLKTLFWFLFM